jgi:hypothetical protein
MTIQDLYLEDGFSGQRVSGEIHGPCPSCGGTTRFVIRRGGKKGDQQCPELGSFWCRDCDISGSRNSAGNAITYLIKVRNMTFPEACEFVGYELPDAQEQPPRRKRSTSKNEHRPAAVWYPAETVHEDFVVDAEKWAEHAEKFVNLCHAALLQRPVALKWFADLGVPLEMVQRQRLGFHHGRTGRAGEQYQNDYKAAKGWGMELPLRPDGSVQDKIVLPAGLVIPCFSAGKVVRIQIRKIHDEEKHLVKGSIGFSGAHMILNPGQRVALVGENERDCMAVAAACPWVTVIPLGSAKCKPCKHDHDELRGKDLILLSLDPDQDKEPGKQAGVDAADWWFGIYPAAQPWYVSGPAGVDIGKAIQSGLNLAEWVQNGIRYYNLALADDLFAPAAAAEEEGEGGAEEQGFPQAPEAVRRMAELMQLRGGVVLRRMEWGWSPDYRSTPMIWTEAQRQEAIKKKFGGWTDEQYDEAQALFGSAEVLSYLNALPEHISSVTAGDILAAGVGE